MEPKPLKYVPPEHVIQFSPDFSMLSHSKLKRRRKRKGDDSLTWFSDVGSTSFKKRQKCKKKKKKVGLTGLSLRAGGLGFPPATMSVAPGYFYWKIEEN